MNLRLLSLYLLVTFIILGAIPPAKVQAASSSSIDVSVVPENPAPGDNTTISLSSYLSNLNSVLISWSVNGKKVASGIGQKSFSLTAPASGGESDVVATVNLPDGAIDTTVVIKPTEMVLLWEAEDSYVPPFYRGKALPSADSEVKVVALPEIRSGTSMVDPNNMTYAWQEDYNNDVGASGYGKNYYIYTNDYLDNSNNIGVTATTIDQKYASNGSIDIGTTPPKIEFYKDDANIGILWEQALSDGYKIQGDAVIEAAPYFISPQDIRTPVLTWNWSINDTAINVVGSAKNEMPLKAQAGVSGTSNVKLEIDSIDKIFETASKSISVQF